MIPVGKISKNFSWSEFFKPEHEGKIKYENILAIRALVWYILQPWRDSLGKALHISSGFRLPEENESVGGAEWSQHLRGEAADVVPDGPLSKALEKLLLLQPGPHKAIAYDSHIHVAIPSGDLVHHPNPVYKVGETNA